MREERTEIDEVVLRRIRVELARPFRTSFGRERAREPIIVELHSDGHVGYGECVAGLHPLYSPETIDAAEGLMERYLVPQLLEDGTAGPRAFSDEVEWLQGHNMAKASVEMALWDLEAKKKGRPLCELLGGEKEEVPCGVSLGIREDEESLFQLIEEHLSEGYRRVKLKIEPGLDVDRVSRVREEFPGAELSVDANAAYEERDIDHLAELDDLGLSMVEQPFRKDDLVSHAVLQEKMDTPVCLDESVENLDGLKSALRLGSGEVLNVKPGRVGGHSSSIQLAEHAVGNSVEVWCGGMLETGIGRAHNVALASRPEFTLPNDISASERYYEEDVVHPEFTVESDGLMEVPKEDGIGVRVKTSLLDELEVAAGTFA